MSSGAQRETRIDSAKQTAPAASLTGEIGWFRRFGFRWLVLYVLLYYLDGIMTLLPGLDRVGDMWDKLWILLIPWIGRHILGIGYAIATEDNGSGDKTADYVQLLAMAALALVGAAIWVWLDRQDQSQEPVDRERNRDAAVHEALRTLIRYVLASAMFVYGFNKVFHRQMPAPGPGRLMEAYGESSPMGLLWTFMGYSAGYSFFAGAAEILGGVLVLFRRTTTLGALVVAGVMANVVAMNFFFDVCVKLYSSHLLLTAIFLLAPDIHRLASVLVLNQPTAQVNLSRVWPRPWMEFASRGLKVFIIGWLLWLTVRPNWRGWERAQHPDWLVGLYRVESVQRNGQSVPLLATDAKLWRQVGVDAYGRLDVMTVRTMNETSQRFDVAIDQAHSEFALKARGVAAPTPIILHYRREGTDKLFLEGQFNGEALAVTLDRVDLSHYLLVNRGFHWINEASFNR